MVPVGGMVTDLMVAQQMLTSLTLLRCAYADVISDQQHFTLHTTCAVNSNENEFVFVADFLS